MVHLVQTMIVWILSISVVSYVRYEGPVRYITNHSEPSSQR